MLVELLKVIIENTDRPNGERGVPHERASSF